jgi:hypothetical protein
LDDLDIRASDLLQANCVVWVEGPSDRLYVNHWIELFAGGELKEGREYQCLLYGGRLLSHLSAEPPDTGDHAVIEILRVNRHAAILIDSDKRAGGDLINSTKQRLVTELSKVSGLAWVTAGKEIENYVPLAAMQGIAPEVTRQVAQFENFSEYLDEQCQDESNKGNAFVRAKVKFAEKIVPHIRKDDIVNLLDMRERLEELVNFISKCNKEREL